VRGAWCETEPRAAVMLVEPADTVDTRPAELTVATAGAEELHCTCDVMLAVLPSEYVPVA
jgi:hypothetical protein